MQLMHKGAPYAGTLHLTSHHLIFSHASTTNQQQQPQQQQEAAAPASPCRKVLSEMWVCYPIIHTVELRPPLWNGSVSLDLNAVAATRPATPPINSNNNSNKASKGCVLRIRCRDFNFFTLNFSDSSQAKEVFESMRNLTCIGTYLNWH